MPDYAATDRFATSEEALIRELDDESVILDLKSEQYFGLDDVGTLIWHQLQEGSTLGEIVDAITDQFEVDEKTATRDLHEFVADLEEQGLIEKQ
jgi:hypothetical protein